MSRAEYWEIPVSANMDRVTRLAVRNIDTVQSEAQPKICIFHDIEENVGTDVSPSECADNLARMLEIEKSFGINTTYNILGLLFSTKYPEIISSNGAHSIGFHSFNHNIADVEQLARCRHIDLRVRGYRPPRSLMTAELTDYDLTFFNFEWLANGVRSLTQVGCALQNGLVKIPIHRDDYLLFTGAVGYEQWERGVLDAAQGKALFGLGLHDCYSGKWLPFYPALLDKLAATGTFAGADEICDQMFLRHPVIPSPRWGAAAGTARRCAIRAAAIKEIRGIRAIGGLAADMSFATTLGVSLLRQAYRWLWKSVVRASCKASIPKWWWLDRDAPASVQP